MAYARDGSGSDSKQILTALEYLIQPIGGVKPTLTLVTVTSTSQTLADLLGRALLATTRRVSLEPQASGIFWASGTASAATSPLGTVPRELSGGPDELDTLEFYAANDIDMVITEEG